MQKIVLLLSLFFCSLYLKGQSAVFNDSVLNLTYKLKDDTFKVNRLIELARSFQHTDLNKADDISNDAIIIAERLKYSYGLSEVYGLKATLNVNQLILDSAELFADKAWGYIKNEKESVATKNQKGVLFNIYGVIYQQKQMYDSATLKYLDAARLFTETRNYKRLYFSFANLSTIYVFLKDTIKMQEYTSKAFETAIKSRDSSIIMRSMLNKINIYSDLNKQDSVIYYSQKGLSISKQVDEDFFIGKFYQATGRYFNDVGYKPDSAIYYLDKAYNYLSKVNSIYDIAINWHELGEAYLQKKDYYNSIICFKKAIELEKQFDLKQLLVYTLDKIVIAEEGLRNFDSAYYHLKEWVTINDSLQRKTQSQNVDELETKYRTEIKDNQLKLQQASIKQKNTLNYILGGSIAALLLISLLSYRTYTQKRKLQEQKIAELEKEKLLSATQSLLKGQEDERSRMAKDLHDGLGGLLSGVKLQLGAMKGNLILSEEHGRTFNNALFKLDESISEMRRVAHNMMPEALMKLGLQQALQDYCDGLSESQSFKINGEFYGLENRMEPSTEIVVYRIVQELLNNAVKHSDATTILAQVIRHGNNLSITVEDNGKGFDTSVTDFTKGAGLANVKSRVEYLKGQMDLRSNTGKGTSVHIECNIDG
ncbi:MAG: ATP-binding protein [Chitinophagaceae bacterium]